MTTPPASARIAIVGGGLAGMAAAVRLAEAGVAVELFEARSALGGRAASYRDPASGELVDFCQHVAMACCTNFHDFCLRTGIAGEFDRYDTLHFFGPEGDRYDLSATRWLPAPLHLGPALLRQRYLSWRERLGIARALLHMARTRRNPPHSTIGAWLQAHRQSDRAVARFWSVVLVSALGETLDRADFWPARQVFVDGFLAHRDAYQIDVPRRSLRELFDHRVVADLQRQGVLIQRNRPVQAVDVRDQQVDGLLFADGAAQAFAGVILAVPYRRVREMVPAEWRAMALPCDPAEHLQSSPITGIHLWFDRELTSLPHAVLVDRFSQWVFRRQVGDRPYYQVVVSASRDLRGMSAESILAAVHSDLQAVFPAAREATLEAYKIVTERDAVFSYRPGTDAARPSQQTPLSNLMLAGDWTQTGWPATLEGAVRSGYLAAQAMLQHLGHAKQLLAPDLPRSWLAKWLWRD